MCNLCTKRTLKINRILGAEGKEQLRSRLRQNGVQHKCHNTSTAEGVTGHSHNLLMHN